MRNRVWQYIQLIVRCSSVKSLIRLSWNMNIKHITRVHMVWWITILATVSHNQFIWTTLQPYGPSSSSRDSRTEQRHSHLIRQCLLWLEECFFYYRSMINRYEKNSTNYLAEWLNEACHGLGWSLHQINRFSQTDRVEIGIDDNITNSSISTK